MFVTEWEGVLGRNPPGRVMRESRKRLLPGFPG